MVVYAAFFLQKNACREFKCGASILRETERVRRSRKGNNSNNNITKNPLVCGSSRGGGGRINSFGNKVEIYPRA